MERTGQHNPTRGKRNCFCSETLVRNLNIASRSKLNQAAPVTPALEFPELKTRHAQQNRPNRCYETNHLLQPCPPHSAHPSSGGMVGNARTRLVPCHVLATLPKCSAPIIPQPAYQTSGADRGTSRRASRCGSVVVMIRLADTW